MRVFLVALLVLAVAMSAAGQVYDRIGVQDIRHGGSWTRTTAGGTATMFGVTPVDVRSYPFSAVGDGSTDDSGAIQAAIDSVGAWGGGSVYFPPGTYSVSSVTVDEDMVSFIGETGSLIKPSVAASYGSNNYLFYVTGDSCSFDGLSFAADAAQTTTYNYAIYGYGSNGLRVKDCTFSGFGYGVATRASSNVSVTGCEASGYMEYGICIWGDANNVLILGNKCHDWDSSGTTGNGIKLAGETHADSTLTRHTNVLIANNQVWNSKGIDAAINGGRGVLVNNNTVANTPAGAYGITYKFNSRSSYSDTTGTLCDGQISGNVIVQNGTGYGINLQRQVGQPDLRRIKVHGNSIRQPFDSSSTTYGLRVYGGSRHDISSNSISGFARGIIAIGADSTAIMRNEVTECYMPVRLQNQLSSDRMYDVYVSDNYLQNIDISGVYDSVIRIDDTAGTGEIKRATIIDNTMLSSGSADRFYDGGVNTYFGERYYYYPAATAPDTTGMRGLVWYDAVNDVLKVYNGSGWQDLH